jgi:hypothetical protein
MNPLASFCVVAEVSYVCQFFYKKVKQFFTEFCVYKSANAGMNEGDEMTNSDTDEETIRLPELCCSKIATVYNFEGNLKQGCTSFFALRRL